jgi:hypothetical protein
VHARRPRHRAELRSTVFMISPSSSSRAASRERLASFDDDEGHRDLALQRVGTPTTATSATFGWLGDALLDLARAEAVARDVDDVVRCARG